MIVNQLSERDIERFIKEEKQAGSKKKILKIVILVAVIAAIGFAAYYVLANIVFAPLPIKPVPLKPGMNLSVTTAKDGWPQMNVVIFNVTGSVDAYFYERDGTLINRTPLAGLRTVAFKFPAPIYQNYRIKIENSRKINFFIKKKNIF